MSYPPTTRRWTAPLWLAFGALVGGLLFTAVSSRDAGAAPEAEVTTKFLSVTGEGPTAKAWYEGAQPSGVPLQRALDTFNQQGYRTVKVTEPHPSRAGEYVWNILMEKGK